MFYQDQELNCHNVRPKSSQIVRLTNGVNGTYGRTNVFLTHAGQTVMVAVVRHINGLLGFVAVLLKVCIYRIFFF